MDEFKIILEKIKKSRKDRKSKINFDNLIENYYLQLSVESESESTELPSSESKLFVITTL
jgi:hypothetical protein